MDTQGGMGTRWMESEKGVDETGKPRVSRADFRNVKFERVGSSPLTHESGSTENEWESVGFHTPNGSETLNPLETPDLNMKEYLLPPSSQGYDSKSSQLERSLLGSQLAAPRTLRTSQQGIGSFGGLDSTSLSYSPTHSQTPWQNEYFEVFQNIDPALAVDKVFELMFDAQPYIASPKTNPSTVISKSQQKLDHQLIRHTSKLNILFFELFQRLNDSPMLQGNILDRLSDLVSCSESNMITCVKENILERLLKNAFGAPLATTGKLDEFPSQLSPRWDLDNMTGSVREKFLRFLVILGTYSMSKSAFSYLFSPIQRWRSATRKEKLRGILVIDTFRSILVSRALQRGPKHYLHFSQSSGSTSGLLTTNNIKDPVKRSYSLSCFPNKGLTFAVWFRIQAMQNTEPSTCLNTEPSRAEVSEHFASAGDQVSRDTMTLLSIRNSGDGAGFEISIQNFDYNSVEWADAGFSTCDLLIQSFCSSNGNTCERIQGVRLSTKSGSGWHWLCVTVHPASFMRKPKLNVYLDATMLQEASISYPNSPSILANRKKVTGSLPSRPSHGPAFSSTNLFENVQKGVTRNWCSLGASIHFKGEESASDCKPALRFGFNGQIARAVLLAEPLPRELVSSLFYLHTSPSSGHAFAKPSALSLLSSDNAVTNNKLGGATASEQGELSHTLSSVPASMYHLSSFGALQKSWDELRADTRNRIESGEVLSSQRSSTLKQIYPKLLFSWDAEFSAVSDEDELLLYDTGPTNTHAVLVSTSFDQQNNAVRLVDRKCLSDQLESAGGIDNFLPLLLECIHSQKDLPLKVKKRATYNNESCGVTAAMMSRVIALLADGLSFEFCIERGQTFSIATRFWLLRKGEEALTLIKSVLLRCCSEALTVELIMAIASLTDTLLSIAGVSTNSCQHSLERNSDLPHAAEPPSESGSPYLRLAIFASRLLFDLGIWSSAPVVVQASLFQVFHHHLDCRFAFIRKYVGVQSLLDYLRLYYYLGEEPDWSLTTPQKDLPKRRNTNPPLTREEIGQCRLAILGLIDRLICGNGSNVRDRLAPYLMNPFELEAISPPNKVCCKECERLSLQDVEHLLGFCQTQQDTVEQLVDVLQYVVSLVSRGNESTIPGLLDFLQARGNLMQLWSLLTSSSSLQDLAIRLLHVYTIRTGNSLHPRSSEEGSILLPLDGPFAFETEHGTHLSMLLLKRGTVSNSTIDALLEFAMGLEIDFDGSALPLSSSRIQYPLLFRTLFECISSDTTAPEVSKYALSRVLDILDPPRSNDGLHNRHKFTRVKAWQYWLARISVSSDDPSLQDIAVDIFSLALFHRMIGATGALMQDGSPSTDVSVPHDYSNSELNSNTPHSTSQPSSYEDVANSPKLTFSSGFGSATSMWIQEITKKAVSKIEAPEPAKRLAKRKPSNAMIYSEDQRSLELERAFAYLDALSFEFPSKINLIEEVRIALVARLLSRGIQLLRQAEAGNESAGEVVSRTRAQFDQLCSFSARELSLRYENLPSLTLSLAGVDFSALTNGTNPSSREADLLLETRSSLLLFWSLFVDELNERTSSERAGDLELFDIESVGNHGELTEPQVMLERQRRYHEEARLDENSSAWCTSLEANLSGLLGQALCDSSANLDVKRYLGYLHSTQQRDKDERKRSQQGFSLDWKVLESAHNGPFAVGNSSTTVKNLDPSLFSKLRVQSPFSQKAMAWPLIDVAVSELESFSVRNCGPRDPSRENKILSTLRFIRTILCTKGIVIFGGRSESSKHDIGPKTPRHRRRSSIDSIRELRDSQSPSSSFKFIDISPKLRPVSSSEALKTMLGSPFVCPTSTSVGEGLSNMPTLELPSNASINASIRRNSFSEESLCSPRNINATPPFTPRKHGGGSSAIARQRQASSCSEAFVLVDEPEAPLSGRDTQHLLLLTIFLCRWLNKNILSIDESILPAFEDLISASCLELLASDIALDDGLADLVKGEWLPRLSSSAAPPVLPLFPKRWTETFTVKHVAETELRNRLLQKGIVILDRSLRASVVKEDLSKVNAQRTQLANRLGASSQTFAVNRYVEEARKTAILRALHDTDAESFRKWKVLVRGIALSPEQSFSCLDTKTIRATRAASVWKLDRRESWQRMRLRFKRAFGDYASNAQSKQLLLAENNSPVLVASASSQYSENGIPAINQALNNLISKRENHDGPSPENQNLCLNGDLKQDRRNTFFSSADWDVVELTSVHYAARNEQVFHSTECELVLPMCVVRGRLDLTASHIYFYGDLVAPPGQSTDESGTGMNKAQSFRRGISRPGQQNDGNPPQQTKAKVPPDMQPLEEWWRDHSDALESKLRPRRWALKDLCDIHSRRYLLRRSAMELFFTNRKNYLLNFRSVGENRLVMDRIMEQNPPFLFKLPMARSLPFPPNTLGNGASGIRSTKLPLMQRQSSLTKGAVDKLLQTRLDEWTNKWASWEMTTFEYLMNLNTAAGRTYNDLTQYPVFPWVLSDFSSEVIDLADSSVYRDLSKPIGALDPERLERFRKRRLAYEGCPEENMHPSFLYGSHYSTIGSVLYFLLRVEPFATYSKEMQGGRFDHADRLFHSIEETWRHCLTSDSDLKELIPEWYYLSSIFKNENDLDLGVRQDGTAIGDVHLPPWAQGSPERFTRINMEALEGEHVSANIHSWIDLIFGFKQRGVEADRADNVFHHLTYEDSVDLDAINDPVLKNSFESQIANFGQTPAQLFQKPHPRRKPPPQKFVKRPMVLLHARGRLGPCASGSCPTIFFPPTGPSGVTVMSDKLTELFEIHRSVRDVGLSQTVNPHSGISNDPTSPGDNRKAPAEFLGSVIAQATNGAAAVAAKVSGVASLADDLALDSVVSFDGDSGFSSPLLRASSLGSSSGGKVHNLMNFGTSAESSGGKKLDSFSVLSGGRVFSMIVRKVSSSEHLEVVQSSNCRPVKLQVVCPQQDLGDSLVDPSSNFKHKVSGDVRSSWIDVLRRGYQSTLLANGSAVASCGYLDHCIKIHSLLDGSLVQNLEVRFGSGVVTSLSQDDSGCYLIGGCQDGAVVVWELAQPKEAEEMIASLAKQKEESASDDRLGSAEEDEEDGLSSEEDGRRQSFAGSGDDDSATYSSGIQGKDPHADSSSDSGDGMKQTQSSGQGSSTATSVTSRLLNTIISTFRPKKREFPPVVLDANGPLHLFTGLHLEPVTSVFINTNLDVVGSCSYSSSCIVLHSLSDGSFLRAISLPSVSTHSNTVNLRNVVSNQSFVDGTLLCQEVQVKDQGEVGNITEWKIHALHINGRYLGTVDISSAALCIYPFQDCKHFMVATSFSLCIYEIENLARVAVLEQSTAGVQRIVSAQVSGDELCVALVRSDSTVSWYCLGDYFTQRR